jgi:hypothetical protein
MEQDWSGSPATKSIRTFRRLDNRATVSNISLGLGKINGRDTSDQLSSRGKVAESNSLRPITSSVTEKAHGRHLTRLFRSTYTLHNLNAKHERANY